MIAKIDKMSNDPLAALQMNDSPSTQKAALLPRSNTHCSLSSAGTSAGVWHGFMERWRRRIGCGTKRQPEPMETAVLEKTIIRIGSMLALGFGEAGAEIVRQTMKIDNGSMLNS